MKKQGDTNGCGLACVAMMAGTSYASVRQTYREVMKIGATGKVEPTRLPALKKIMRHHGIRIDGRARRGRELKPEELNLQFDALLKVNLRLGGEEWHWILWDNRRRRVLDPKQTPYKRLKVAAYWKLRRTARHSNQGADTEEQAL